MATYEHDLRLISSQRASLQEIYNALEKSEVAKELNKKVDELIHEFADAEIRIDDELNSNR